MRTVVCIASGPSLTREDCVLVRESGLFTIVVNNSWQMAPWANVLYAGDRQWWSQYGAQAKSVMRECWTASHDSAERFGINRFEAKDWENSGYQAIELAILKFNASKVVLLGYDMQHTGGARHWHSDHPEQMGNADDVEDWPDRFFDLRDKFADVEFVNCTRETALTCFKRESLKSVLENDRCKQGN
jgi:hypothetical protein